MMAKKGRQAIKQQFGKTLSSILVVVMALGLTNIMFADSAEIDSGQVISEVKVAGNRTIKSEKILAKTRSRADGVFDKNVANEDTKRIAELDGVEYNYYNTELVDGKVVLTFVVVERSIVRSVTFKGNAGVKRKVLVKQLGFKLGDYLDPVLAELAKDTVVDYYKKKGYAFVQIELQKDQLEQGRVTYIIDEGPRVRIAAVKFSGNNLLKTKSLKKVVKTKKKKLYFLKRYYVSSKVDTDVTRLKSAYQSRGFLDAQVTAEEKFNADKSKLSLTFVIDEGPVYAIESIKFTGNEYFSADDLQAQLKSTTNDTYRQKMVESDVKRLAKLYQEKGFIDADVIQNRKFVPVNRVDLVFEISEGEQFRIGKVEITGNKQTQDKVVRRVLNEYDFKPGEFYDGSVASGDGRGSLETILRRTLMAEESTISPSGNKLGVRDAQVNVAEGKTGMVMLGAGVASDSGVIGQLVFEQKDFDYRDTPESFSEFISGQSFRGAGQTLRVSLEPGTEVSQYSINFTEPYFRDKPISLDLLSSSWERGRESYDEGRLKGYVGIEKRYKNKWRKGIAFRVENVDISDLDLEAPKEIVDVKGDNLIVGVKFSAGRDMTNDKFVPSDGYRFMLSAEPVGGDDTFGILSGTYLRYYTLREDLAERKTVLATKLLAATTVGDAPPFEQFYGGGTGSHGMRGFDYRGVSKRGTSPLTGEKDDPIGSEWILLANAEVTMPLVSETLSWLLFVDTGLIDTGGARASIGAGIQILIPQWFGPVPMRFELAVPFLKDGDDETQVFSFSVGRLF